MPSFLRRFQKIFVLPLIVLLAALVIGLTWWTIQLQLGIIESDLDRTGKSTAENLSKSGLAATLQNDRESLSNLVNLVKEKEGAITAVAFFNREGRLIFSDGEEIKLPMDPDGLKFLNLTKIAKAKYTHLFLSPIADKQNRVNGVAAVLMSNEKLSAARSFAMWIFTVIVLMVIGFNVFIYHYLVREALRASELEKAYQNLKRLQDEILQSEKMAAIGRLASGVGHELRNPLGAIKNAVYYIKDAISSSNLLQVDPAVADFIEVIETEIKSSTAIINDLLDYSKVGKLHPQITDLNALILETRGVLDIPKNVNVTEFLAEGLPSIFVDPLRLRQVFINLAVNAFQAMPEGGELKILTGLESRNPVHELWISFKDTGQGIIEENKKKIFDPLFTTKEKGTGLGLAICLGIVDAHKGKIDFESRVGKGSEFIVKLPLNKEQGQGGGA